MKIQTDFTRAIGCDVPIVVAPMFLVSNIDMVVAGSQAGALGAFPALNARPVEKLRDWLQEIRRRTQRPYAVNLIVHRSNIYFEKQMEICLEERVPVIIASLGDPSLLIAKAHEAGSKVFCDVIFDEHARKAVNAGADGLVAVSGGAGGHAGSISSMVWIPYLRQRYAVPILAAGNVATGQGLAAALALGASGVYLGTRFIASSECPVTPAYKQAIINARPQDIVTTYKLDGVAANVINTPYVQKMGTQLTWLERLFLRSRRLRPLLFAFRTIRSVDVLAEAARKVTWKELWGAGQVAGLVDDIAPIADIICRIVAEYEETIRHFPAVESE